MFEKNILKNLKADEEKVAIVREYGFVIFFPVLIASLAIVLDFFLMYPLWRLGWWGVLIFLFVIVISASYIIRRIAIWSLNVFFITNRRIIDLNQNGLFSKSVTETTFDKIQDISYNKKGICATLLDYGDVIVKTASNDESLELKKVHHPAEVQDMLTECQSKFSKES
jgi:uncharacterized membrane protein YdbT with pleckstrin-like domain